MEDWDKVVRKTIARRVDDFRVKMLKDTGRLITENRIDSSNERYNLDETSGVDSKEQNAKGVIEGILEYVFESDDQQFTEFDFEVLELLVEQHKLGNNPKDSELCYLMGYDKSNASPGFKPNSFHNKLKKLRSKLKLLKERFV